MNKKILTSVVVALSMSLASSVFAAGKEDAKKGNDVKRVEENRDKANRDAGKTAGEERTAKDIKNETIKLLDDGLKTARGLKSFQGVEIANAQEIFNRIGNVDVIKTLVEEGIQSKSVENQELAAAIVQVNSKKMTDDSSLEIAVTNTLAQAITKSGQMFEKSSAEEFKKQRENVLALSRSVKEKSSLEDAIKAAADRRGMDYAQFVELLKKCAQKA